MRRVDSAGGSASASNEVLTTDGSEVEPDECCCSLAKRVPVDCVATRQAINAPVVDKR
jgi:hypothetical protein